MKIILVTLNKLIYDFRNICGCLTLNEMLIKLASLIICSINDNLTKMSSTPNYSEDYEIFAIKCEIYLYDLTHFGRNYFSSICCSCVHLNKNLVCCHCKRLRHALNTDTIKICLKKEDLPREFKLVELEKYLEHLKADPIFYYSKEENEIKLSIGSLDWGDFFVDKKTM